NSALFGKNLPCNSQREPALPLRDVDYFITGWGAKAAHFRSTPSRDQDRPSASSVCVAIPSGYFKDEGLFGRGCSHRFTWPRTDAHGRHHQNRRAPQLLDGGVGILIRTPDIALQRTPMLVKSRL